MFRPLLLTIFLLLSPLLIAARSESDILVNNRILALVNGKTLSVIDVMKQMDVYLTKAYPEHAKSTQHRLQFFSQNWRQVLNQMIDNELILADAEKLKINIADAEIREIIHKRFGPNIMASLDRLGLSLDEAWDMIYSEIVVQKMTGFRVYSKVMHSLGPQTIKNAYQNHLLNNPPKEEWKYQVLAIRAKTESLGSFYAKKAYSLANEATLSFEQLPVALQESVTDSNVSISLSEEYCIEGKRLSDAHRAILTKLPLNSYSEPVLQVSRVDGSVVHRIFYLKELKITPPPTFGSMTDELQDQLFDQGINKELPLYLNKLRKEFHFDDSLIQSIPANFEPFILQ